MKTKAILLLFAFSLVSGAPAYAQGRGHHYGRGHGKGNPHTDKQHTDKQGPHDNDDGDDEDDDNDDDYALLKAKIAEVVASLSNGSMAAPDGAPIPISAQGKLYVVMTNTAVDMQAPPAASVLVANSQSAAVPSETSPSPARFMDAFAGAGPAALDKLRVVTKSLAGITIEPRRLHAAVANFNAFVDAAPGEFLASPPPEFSALHAVLAKLTAAIRKKR